MILDGKTVLVTGVGEGLGRECAASALRDGANVVLARDRRHLELVAAELDPGRDAGAAQRHRHHRPRLLRGRSSSSPRERFGSVDALIQVAAFEHAWGGLYDLKFEDWRAAFDTNVLGALTVIRPVAEAMKEGGGGSVVLIGSQSMFQPPMPQSGYAASKSALLTAMYYLCDELGPDNIRCNMVIPSWMWGPNVEMLRDRDGAPDQGRTEEEVLHDIVGQLPAPADDRGRRGGRRRGVLRLRPRQGGDRPVPAGQLRRDAPMSAAPKRVVVWGTGFVGKMVIPEIVRHPAFELVGVGVSDPEKVGRDVGEICGIGPVGITATDDVDALVALRPDALVHYGPTAAHADDNIARHRRLPAGRHRRVLDGHDPVGVAVHGPRTRRRWIDPITEACEPGGASCFTTGIDPGFANDLFPMTLMGLCSEVRQVRALEILDYINYEGDYEDEMGIGRPPEFTSRCSSTPTSWSCRGVPPCR